MLTPRATARVWWIISWVRGLITRGRGGSREETYAEGYGGGVFEAESTPGYLLGEDKDDIDASGAAGREGGRVVVGCYGCQRGLGIELLADAGEGGGHFLGIWIWGEGGG